MCPKVRVAPFWTLTWAEGRPTEHFQPDLWHEHNLHHVRIPSAVTTPGFASFSRTLT